MIKSQNSSLYTNPYKMEKQNAWVNTSNDPHTTDFRQLSWCAGHWETQRGWQKEQLLEDMLSEISTKVYEKMFSS